MAATSGIRTRMLDRVPEAKVLPMRAVHVVELSGPDGLRLVDIPAPHRGDSLLLEVHAVGVRYADLLRSKGQYQERSEPPYVPFNEVSGVVVEAPDAGPFRRGERVAGIVNAAGAELATGPSEAFIRLPADMSFEEGAGAVMNYQTAIFGLEVRGRMAQGEAVLIHGAAGGTGTAALQVAKAAGAKTIAVVSTDAKAEIARRAGANHVLRSDGPWRDEAMALTEGRGVDLVWDPVGGDRVADTIRALAPLGRWVVIGFTGGPIPSVPLNRILLKNIDVVGAYFSGYTASHPDVAARLHSRLAALVDAGHVRPIVGSVHPIADAAEALRSLGERRAVGKVVIKVR